MSGGRRALVRAAAAAVVATVGITALGAAAPAATAAGQARAGAGGCTPTDGYSNCQIFDYTGKKTQTFTVPQGVSKVFAKVWGAGGGGGKNSGNKDAYGGAGGYAQGTISVQGGQQLTLTTAGGGDKAYQTNAAGGYGDGNGGSISNAALSSSGGGGGGASSVRSGDTRLLVAGGGGGSSATPGGAGGGDRGQDGSGTKQYPDTSGRGGSDGKGGSGGNASGFTPSEKGGDGFGANGGTSTFNHYGGAGGGGYGGGGGGQGEGNYGFGGGGGGGGYVSASLAGGKLMAGDRQTPGNAGDVQRGKAGGGGSSLHPAGFAGRIVLEWNEPAAPVAKDDGPVKTVAGKPSAPIDVLANDSISGDRSKAQIELQNNGKGQHGTATVKDGKVVYTPADSTWTGKDSFTYKVKDEFGQESSKAATVTMTVTPGKPSYLKASDLSQDALGDFDGDKKADLVGKDKATGGLYEWKGNGKGAFEKGRELYKTWDYTQTTAGDFDGDGKTDLVAAKGDTLYEWKGKGDGTFQDPVKLTDGWNGYTQTTAGDFDGDGKADVIAMDTKTDTLYLWKGQDKSGNPFAKPKYLTRWNGYTQATAGDYNGDGKADLLAHTPRGNLDYWQSDGNLTPGHNPFAKPKYLTRWNGYTQPAAGDLTADGKTDLLAVDTNNNTIKTWNSTGTTTPHLFTTPHTIRLQLPN
ncbi:FG-GAP-like repeat-containing protein (plasmid) [Streptoverticillium reticulum]|uniref:FG-GAP-like repeat-containing protein n=1 Tax=Streptoverticillium reticulum TaxID=1433415 RepID=UPI0039BF56C5